LTSLTPVPVSVAGNYTCPAALNRGLLYPPPP
jgi:hypothetical protein